MKTIKYPDLAEIKDILKRPLFENEIIKESVLSIINEVKLNGDKALIEFTQKFDGIELDKLHVSESEINEADKVIDSNLNNAIEIARKNIYKFHKSQVNTISKIEIEEGITCWRKDVPIQKVGLYIPGGSSPLFSTLLMLAIPAQIAGCDEIIICTPPQKNGNVAPSILFVAKLLGIKKIFKVGGAQAIAAMAFGTETIPKVDKIFGPGNQWVTAAKQIVNSFGVAIDMPAGPSEVLVIADDSANAKFVASDLLSQAEHGADSQVILISTSEKLITKVEDEVNILTNQLSRKMIIEQSLNNCVIILVNNLDEAIAISNIYAPEHLILAVENSEMLAEKVVNAGSVFLGNYSPESAGDYATGTNHTLPTNGFASTYSGVSLGSFMKKITFQKLTKSGLDKIAFAIEAMADAEGLDAHKLAVTIRRFE
ncbi:MAG: histidinol dehydrogenase [Bacteroidetes bacterium]|nr:histidinol dehydrogenase [Bacteroidota bacterium]MBU1113800.1 histidinol dehydrogenase [Bacteroidota bacterium]MBU1799614.1 histidinol dehydrogenase [Bacteroidota bacterium]